MIATDMLNVITHSRLPPSRGRLPSFRKVPLHPTQPHASSAATAISKAKGLCKELLSKAAHWPSTSNLPWTRQMFQTIANLRKNCTHVGLELSVESSTSEHLRSSIQAAFVLIRKTEDDINRKSRQLFLEEWKKRLNFKGPS